MTAASASRRRWALLLAWLASPVALFIAVLLLLAAGMRCDEGCSDAPTGAGPQPGEVDWRETSIAWQWGLLAVLAIVALAVFLSFLVFVAQAQRRCAKYALFAYLLLTYATMAWFSESSLLGALANWQDPAELVPFAAALAAAGGAVWLTPPRDDDARTQPQQETPRATLSLDAEVEQVGRERDDWRERTREF